MAIMITITINGETKEVAENQTIKKLTDSLNLQEIRFAVEVNEELIPRSEHEEHQLKANDQLEIVQAIGGG